MGLDAEARFAMYLDSSGMVAGARSGISALDKLRARIQQQQKALAALKTSMQSLKSSAAVVRFQAIPKELEKAQAEAKKLESQLVKNRAKQAAKQEKGVSDLGLEMEAKSLES